MKAQYISLGHRCHIYQAVKRLGVTKCTYPFDHLVSSWEGIVNCFEDDFKNFFPKNCHKTTVTRDCLSEQDGPRDDENCRIIFKGKYFCYTHHDVRESSVIAKFKERIKRFDKFLSNVKEPVVFLRTICFKNEHKQYDLFKNAIKRKYPKLNFKVVFIATIPGEKPFRIFRHGDCILAEDSIVQADENEFIIKDRYKELIEYLDSNDIFNNFDELHEVGDEYVVRLKDGVHHVPPSKEDGNQYPFDESN